MTEAYLYYKLTYEPKGSGELKMEGFELTIYWLEVLCANDCSTEGGS